MAPRAWAYKVFLSLFLGDNAYSQKSVPYDINPVPFKA